MNSFAGVNKECWYFFECKGGKLNKADIKKVLIVRPNHRLGNQILITPIVQDVTDFFPEAKIDLLVKGNVAPIIFQNYKNIDHILRLPKQHFKQLLQYPVIRVQPSFCL